MKTLLLIFITATLVSCQSSVREEIERESPSWPSPDDKALIYQSHYIENGIVHISLATWIKNKFMEGGGGIFDIKTNKLTTLLVKWITDSSAIISYPKSAMIVRQLHETYFAGRKTYLSYNPENN